jgi:hypothetical protein
MPSIEIFPEERGLKPAINFSRVDLPQAGRTDDAHQLAWLNIQGDPVQHVRPNWIGFAYLADFNMRPAPRLFGGLPRRVLVGQK